MTIPAASESCDGIDNNCNGSVDEGCLCEDGKEQECSLGPERKRVGECPLGKQKCVDRKWGICDGAKAPDFERCGGLDNDCNGTSDDRCACAKDADCPKDLSCVDGFCRKSDCPSGQVRCSGSCVDTKASGTHCGACENACAGGKTCQEGACKCPSGKTDCGGACVDTLLSGTHCGGCDKACATQEVCSNGKCALNCPSEQVACAGGCVDTNSNSAHCGGCGQACTGGKICNNGTCQCPQGTAFCDGACVNIQTSVAHCGACSSPCDQPRLCTGGSCACSGTLSFCAGGCVDASSSKQHCGSCGNACAGTKTCASGQSVGESTLTGNSAMATSHNAMPPHPRCPCPKSSNLSSTQPSPTIHSFSRQQAICPISSGLARLV
ncbi:hypothetical protein L6R29_09100 [Myxococcota bacterium]|nr:hypothetical protein [Myxococcota bacterium]